MIEFFKKPKVLIVILIFMVVPVAILALSLFSKEDQAPQSKTDPFPSPSPIENNVPNLPNASPGLNKTIPGGTKENEILKIEGIRIVSKNENQTTYEYNSVLNQRPNEIIAEKGTASFERLIITPEQYSQGITVSFIKQRYGEPEEIIRGSTFYGSYLHTYIYAGRGVAFIVNQNTGEIYEAQFYVPMSIEMYKQKYGQDINQNIRDEHSF